MFIKFKNTSIILSIVLLFLFISEIFLINQNFYLKKKISDYGHLEQLLSQAQNKIEYFNSIDSFEGLKLPFYPSELYESKKISNLKHHQYDYILLFCFFQHDCASCLRSIIHTWNKFQLVYPQKKCQVIGITDTLQYRNLKAISQSLGIRFPLFHVPDLKNQLTDYGVHFTPMIILGDLRTNKVIYIDFNAPYYASTNEKFIQKLQKFFDLYNK